MTLKNRLRRLEGRRADLNKLPFIVKQRAGETSLEAVERTLNGRAPPPGWCFVLSPPELTLEEWKKKYSPQFDV